MNITIFALAAILGLVPPLTWFEDLRKSEVAFAQAFADRDKEAFFAMVADDAAFLSPGSSAYGKEQVIAHWSRYFESPEAPFSWTPDRIFVSSTGVIGLSTGPVYDAKGVHAGDFISTWRNDGKQWKIVFDSNGPGPAPLPELALKIEEGFITTPDGVKLFYRKLGRGPLTAIAPLDFVMFDQVKQFANIATIITYDLRNRGRSGKAKDVTIQDDVKDLETVRQHFKLEKFVPIGFSYLGKMVIMYAVGHPDRVSRIIQLGPLGNRAVQMPTSQDFGAPPEVITKWQEMAKSDGIEKTPREACLALGNLMAYYMAGNPKNASRFDVDGGCVHENEWPVHVNPHFASLMKSPSAELTAEQLKKVSVPVLTIHGTKDRQAAYEGGVAWVKSLPDARLVTIEDAAHAMWLDDPALLGASIRQFLRGDWPLVSVGGTALRASQ